MLPKKYRLKTKDVIYLTKKKQFFSSGLFSFFYIPQYPNLSFHQISFHVSIKLSKHSTARNIIKRAVIRYIQDQEMIQKKREGWYYKIFIMLNKNNLETLQKQIANLPKKNIITSVQQQFAGSFRLLQSKVWASSKTSWIDQKTSWAHSNQKIKNNLMNSEK